MPEAEMEMTPPWLGRWDLRPMPSQKAGRRPCHAEGSRAHSCRSAIGFHLLHSLCGKIPGTHVRLLFTRRIEWQRSWCRKTRANNWTHQNGKACCVNVPTTQRLGAVKMRSHAGVDFSLKGFTALDTHLCLSAPLQLASLASFARLCIPSYTFYHLLLLNAAWLARQALYRHARSPARLDNSLKGKKKSRFGGRKKKTELCCVLQCNERGGALRLNFKVKVIYFFTTLLADPSVQKPWKENLALLQNQNQNIAH